jgi:hypothetical protein
MKMEQCSETSAYKIQTPGNYPEESIQQFNTWLNNITVGVFLLNWQMVYDYELHNDESMFPFNIILT